MISRRALLAAGALMPVAARAQGYYERGGSKQRAVRFAGAEGVALEGTLVLPLRSEIQYVPGVVMIAGSGPTDRDGNNAYVPERIDLLRQLALTLADAGIASLRYDNRGIGASTRPPPSLADQERFFTWEHFVADVQAAHGELLRHDEIKSYATGMIGHSEGGLLAIAASAAMAAKRPHALTLMATPGRPLREIVRSQVARNAPAFSAETDRVMAAIEASGRTPTRLSPELQPLFPAYAGPFLKAALAFDPAAELARLDNACLLLQGAADKQVVAMEDVQPLFDALARRTVSGEALVVPGASHNFKAVSSPFDHGFGGPVVAVVAAKLTGWLATVLGA